MQIDPNRLKELRQGKGFSRARLADRSKISQRQITRIENDTAATGNVRERTVTELARALGVEPGVLTGDLPMPDAGPHAHSSRGVSRQVSARLQPKASLACALVKRRYGVGLTTLFNAAPLMFVLLAENSFVWRRERAKEADEAADRLRKLGLGSWEFALGAQRAEDGAAAERASIEGRNVFGEDLFDNADWDEGYNRFEHNPFADYLRNLAAKIDDPDIVEIGEDIHDSGALENFPWFTVCNGDLDRFSGASEKLNFALRQGLLRIDHAPEELWADDAANRRREWLEQQFEEQLPDEMKETLDRLLSLKLDHAKSDEEETAR